VDERKKTREKRTFFNIVLLFFIDVYKQLTPHGKNPDNPPSPQNFSNAVLQLLYAQFLNMWMYRGRTIS
jgi:hypothetical protein